MSRSQEQVRDWWNRNPMSYDVDDPIAAERGTRAYFEEIDRRIFDPRHMRLTARPGGRPFSRYVDFDRLAGKQVLEVGCGSGIAVQLFADAGADVTAVDLTPWAVETTRARLEAFGLEGTVLEADGEQLPFEDGSFDLVFSWGVIHHTTDMERALLELARVCRPGGTVVLMLYHRRSLFFVSSTGIPGPSTYWITRSAGCRRSGFRSSPSGTARSSASGAGLRPAGREPYSWSKSAPRVGRG